MVTRVKLAARWVTRVCLVLLLCLSVIFLAEGPATASPMVTINTYNFTMSTSFGATILTGAEHSVPSFVYLTRPGGGTSIPGTSTGWYRCTSDAPGTWRSGVGMTIGAGDWQATAGISCGSDYITDLQGRDSSSVVFFEWTANYTPPTSPTSTCSSAFWKGPPVAALVSGTLSVRFKWAGPVQPAGWKVYPLTSATATPGTLLGTVPALDPYASYPGWKGADLGSASTSPYWRLESTTDPGCWVAVAQTTVAPVIDPPDYGSDPDEGSGCGLNPFCHVKAALKWAFVPSDATMDAFTGAFADMSDKFPFGLIVDLGETTGQITEAPSCAVGTNTCWIDFEFQGQPLFDEDSYILGWVFDHRELFGIVLYTGIFLGLGMRVFWAVMPVVGGGGKSGDGGQ